MNATARGELLRLIQQLRTELEWASRTGLEVAHASLAAKPPSDISDELEGFDPLPVDAGRPAPPEPREAGQDEAEEEVPPAFEPDPVEPEVLKQAASVPPSALRRGKAPEGRPPWEPYLTENDAPPRTQGAPSDPPETATPLDAEADSVRLAAARSLDEVRAILGACTRCKLHQAGRRQIVFGVGAPNADVMFIGEGPGRQEDIQGEPFVGDAGQLLTRIIENGMGLRRADVYIANIVKCRPPRNRDPEPDEVSACEPFLKGQIAQIKPRVIVALGKYAAQTLLRTTTPISRLRGRWHTYAGIDLMPTFHPAYLLRNPSEKRVVWEDIQAVMRALGMLPAR